MLLELSVRDFALVDSLRLDLRRGFIVLTGETGAGKSLLVGALGVALGGRADEEMVRRGATEARIEARFELEGTRLEPGDLEESGIPWPEDGELLIVREIQLGGKSRARVNDRAVTVSALRRIGARLADLHGQHEHQWLLDPARQLAALDRYAGLARERRTLAAAHAAYREARSHLEAIEQSLRASREEDDLRRFQLQELRAAGLRAGEEQDLTIERERLRHAETIRMSLEEAEGGLYAGEGSAEDRIGAARRALDRVASIDPRLAAVNEELLSAARILDDVANEIRRAREGLDADPHRLQQIEDRLHLLHELRRKYQALDENALLARLDALESRFDAVERAPELHAAARAETASRGQDFLASAKRASRARQEAGARLAGEVMKELAEMAMPRAVFSALLARAVPLETTAPEWGGDHDPLAELGPEGGDTLEFMLAANPGEAPLPLRRVASGGELSRVMLGLKSLLAEADEVDTLVFDEIDAGIGGDAARAVGERMQTIGTARQVLCITHLPQIAALGDHHVHVEKTVSGGRTRVLANELSDDQRITELARMIAGSEPSDLALRHGREMLATGKRRSVRRDPARRDGVKL